MAKMFSVSLRDEDKELLKWITERKKDGTFPSPSIVFRDGLVERMKEWNLANSGELSELKTKLSNWQKIVDQQRDFMESKGVLDDFIEFGNGGSKIPKKQIETHEKPHHMIIEKDQSLKDAALKPNDRDALLGVIKNE